MAFSMSGVSDGYSYNRFDIYEKKSKDCDCKPKEDCDCDDKKSKKSSGSKPDYLDFDKDGDKEEPMTDALGEGMMPLPKEKMERQSNKAYAKEVVAAKQGDEKETNKQMQRRIAMKNPAGRKNQLMNKEEVEQDGPKPTPGQAAGAQKNILSKLRLLKNKQGEETKEDKQELALQKARAKAFGMKEEKSESERSDAMPAGDVGHDIHKRAVKSYNKNNPSTKVKEDLESTGLFSEQEISVILEALLGKN